MLAVVGFVLLSGGDNGRSDGGSRPQAPTTPRERGDADADGREDGDADRRADAEPTPSRRRRPPRRRRRSPPPAGPDLARARQLQVQGFNARQAGDYEQALALSQQALEACGDAQRSTRAATRCSRSAPRSTRSAGPTRRSRSSSSASSEYGDNSSGEVKAELDKARGEKAKKPRKEKGD